MFAYLLIIGLTLVAIFFVFRAEFVNGLTDTVNSNQFAIKGTLSDSAIIHNDHFILRPERNDSGFIQVSNFTSGTPSSLGTPINFEMTNVGDSNDFPNIKVFLVNYSGKIVRIVKFGSNDYQHSDKFEIEKIQVLISLNPGETKFTVQPYYEQKS